MTYTIDIAGMPPNLLELYMPCASSSEAVLQCKHLTKLVLEDCQIAARELQALSSLNDLKERRLSHIPDAGNSMMPSWLWHNYAADAATAWKFLPLKSLECVIDLRAIMEYDAESDATDFYSATSNDLDQDSHTITRRSRNIMLLEELALQNGLTCLDLVVHTQPPDSEVMEQLGLLHAPLQHLINLRELYIGMADQPHPYSRLMRHHTTTLTCLSIGCLQGLILSKLILRYARAMNFCVVSLLLCLS